MWFKFLAIFLAIFLASVVQASFLAHFTILGNSANLVFVVFAVVIFYECILNRLWPREFYKEIMVVVVAGFFADLFSSFSFGLSIAIFLVLYLAIKTAIYFLKEIPDRYLIVYFLAVFAPSFFAYHAVLGIISNNLRVNTAFFIALAYNIVLAAALFYFYKKIDSIKSGRQLKLFH